MSRTHPAFANFPISFEAMLTRFAGEAVSRVMPLKVNDGDTFEALGELPRHEIDYKAYRLLGVNAPEIHGGTSESKALAQKAKDFLTALIMGRPMIVITYRDKETFDRYVAIPLTVDDTGATVRDIREDLLANGLVVPWTPSMWVARVGWRNDSGVTLAGRDKIRVAPR